MDKCKYIIWSRIITESEGAKWLLLRESQESIDLDELILTLKEKNEKMKNFAGIVEDTKIISKVIKLLDEVKLELEFTYRQICGLYFIQKEIDI